MVAQDEAVTRILQLNKKFDTVMVYPAFGNEVSKAKALNSSELLRLLADFMFCQEKWHHVFLANQMYTKLMHIVILRMNKKNAGSQSIFCSI